MSKTSRMSWFHLPKKRIQCLPPILGANIVVTGLTVYCLETSVLETNTQKKKSRKALYAVVIDTALTFKTSWKNQRPSEDLQPNEGN